MQSERIEDLTLLANDIKSIKFLTENGDETKCDDLKQHFKTIFDIAHHGKDWPPSLIQTTILQSTSQTFLFCTGIMPKGTLVYIRYTTHNNSIEFSLDKITWEKDRNELC